MKVMDEAEFYSITDYFCLVWNSQKLPIPDSSLCKRFPWSHIEK